MKPRIHPVSRPVAFRDRAGGAAFLRHSTAHSAQRMEWEHSPTLRVTDIADRIERFQRGYASPASGD
jgi:large subunit ribosomal protein L31